MRNAEPTPRLGKGSFKDKVLRGIWRLRGGKTRNLRGVGRQLWLLMHAVLEAVAFSERMDFAKTWILAESMYSECFKNWWIPNLPVFTDNCYAVKYVLDCHEHDAHVITKSRDGMLRMSDFGGVYTAPEREVHPLEVNKYFYMSKDTYIHRLAALELVHVDKEVPQFSANMEWYEEIAEMNPDLYDKLHRRNRIDPRKKSYAGIKALPPLR